MKRSLYFLGCPVWASPRWQGNLFTRHAKRDQWLQQYSHVFNAVEGNSTFYALPSLDTVRRWVDATEPPFRFVLKFPQAISHEQRLVNAQAKTEAFLERLRILDDARRLGPSFLQLPPTYSPAMLADLNTFLDAWPQPFRLAVEVRHPGWFGPPHDEALHDLLTAKSMGRVVIDTRPIRDLQEDRILAGSVYKRLLEARLQKPDLPVFPKPTADFVFLRYIGHPQAEVNTPYLDEWGSFLAERLQEGMDAYVFCHCPDERLDPWLCRQLHGRVSSVVGPSLPTLPWDDVESDVPRQARLF